MCKVCTEAVRCIAVLGQGVVIQARISSPTNPLSNKNGALFSLLKSQVDPCHKKKSPALRPLLWSVVLVCATGFATWSVICVLLAARRRKSDGVMNCHPFWGGNSKLNIHFDGNILKDFPSKTMHWFGLYSDPC